MGAASMLFSGRRYTMLFLKPTINGAGMLISDNIGYQYFPRKPYIWAENTDIYYEIPAGITIRFGAETGSPYK